MPVKGVAMSSAEGGLARAFLRGTAQCCDFLLRPRQMHASSVDATGGLLLPQAERVRPGEGRGASLQRLTGWKCVRRAGAKYVQ